MDQWNNWAQRYRTTAVALMKRDRNAERLPVVSRERGNSRVAPANILTQLMVQQAFLAPRFSHDKYGRFCEQLYDACVRDLEYNVKKFCSEELQNELLELLEQVQRTALIHEDMETTPRQRSDASAQLQRSIANFLGKMGLRQFNQYTRLGEDAHVLDVLKDTATSKSFEPESEPESSTDEEERRPRKKKRGERRRRKCKYVDDEAAVAESDEDSDDD